MKYFINNQRLAQLAGVGFRSEKINPTPIVYSRTHTVVSQFDQLATFPECVLVTSFSDACCTIQMAKKLPPNVKKWYSNNVSTNNLRVVPVPIGLRTSPESEVILRNQMENGRPPQRNLVYMNFLRHIPRQPNPRKGLYEFFGGNNWVTEEGGYEHTPMKEFYEQIASHPFIISPPGAGPDCHRHWESILLGSIPIVLKSRVTVQLLNDLPCLQVNNWTEVTEEKLNKELPRLKKRFNSEAMGKIWFDYWKERILNERG